MNKLYQVVAVSKDGEKTTIGVPQEKVYADRLATTCREIVAREVDKLAAKEIVVEEVCPTA